MKIFISYRRADVPDAVARIYSYLKDRLRNTTLFYDHRSIDLGSEFPEVLRREVTAAEVVLVVIGPEWVRLLHERKTAPIDHVREEVRLALQSGAQVIPVLVNNARMPSEADLADFAELLPLLTKNAQPILPEPHFDYGCGKLLEHLERTGPDEIVGTIIGGKYKVLREIGKGGMGTVYLAEQAIPTRRTLVVKLM